MKLTKQKEKELLKVYDTWLHSYLHGDVETYDFFLDDSYHFIGSTVNEELLNRNETTDFFKATADQFAGKTELRNEKKLIEKFGELVILTHVFDGWFLNEGGWSYYGRFRFTSTLQEKKEGWRFIYQHFSTTDSKAEEQETIGYDQVSTENLKLREAVKRRTVELQEKNRELEVETALERIRAQAVAMKESSDLLDIVVTMRNEFIKLGHEAHYFWHMMWLPETYEKAMTSGDGSKIGFVMELPRHIHGDIPLLAKWEKSKKPTVVYAMNVQEALDYVDKMVSLGDFQNIDPQAPTEDDIRHIGGLTFIMARTSHGEIGFSLPGIVKNPPKEDIDILVKFAGAFDLAHRRFLDLKKAEKQASEVKVEAALERIRSRTMGMQKSEELVEFAILLQKEFKELGFNQFFEAGYILVDEEKDTQDLWVSNFDGTGINGFTLPLVGDKVLQLRYDSWKRKDPVFCVTLEGETLVNHIEFVLPHLGSDDIEDQVKNRLPDPTYLYSGNFTHGFLTVVSNKKLNEEQEVLLVRFSGVFEQTYTRFLDVQKAEAQAREAQIEAALERVRSKTMAMHNSSDVEDTVLTFFGEVLKLGLDKSIRCGIGILEGFEGMETTSANTGLDGKVELRVGMLDMSIHPMLVGLKKAWKKGSKGYSYEYTEKDVRIYYEALNNDPGYPFNADLDTLPKREFHKSFFFSSGIIFAFTENPISEEASQVLDRFSDVFGQTYRRYLDLLKAEEQAKEAQIEAALEKVRARTMAMQASDELRDAANLLFLEIQSLGINIWSAGYNILSSDKTKSVCWMSSEGELQDPFPLYFTKEASFKEMGTFLKSEADFFVQELEGKALEQHYDYMKSLPELENTFKHIVEAGLSLPTYQINHLCKFSQGFLLFITYEKVPEAHDTFKRFTKVFEQTYTRFLDLQKAENQSKEAQIELALERVRASSMAMHKSEQLAETAEVLFEQFDLLGIIPDRISIAITNEEKRIFELWATDQSGTNVDHGHDFSIDEPTCMAKNYKAWKEGKETLVVDLKGEELEDWTRFVKEDAKMELDESKFMGRRVQHSAFFSDGFLLLSSHLPLNDEVMAFMQRFAKVFQQTYTRFLDLEKAETQAREVVKHASVDRIRAEIASMRTTTDLKMITPLVWNELNTLDVSFIRCGVFIMDEELQEMQTHLSTSDGKAIASFQLPFEDLKPLEQLLPFWRRKEMFTDYWDQAAFIESTKTLMDKGMITSSETYLTGNQPKNLYLHFLPFLQGMLYVGSEVSLTKDELNLVQNLAKAFSTAYSRYEDFNKLELANKKIEKTLVDLKQTQAQLIQSEKMASLGQLTAGIAHEIQNPLNFVNNFSEVSQELMKEMQEELDNGDLEEAREIGNDIEQNLDKINRHGQRASNIVKGMLQHSRSSSGTIEQTDVNALVDEYLRLAYHGLRAKDKTFNATLETFYEENLKKVNVIPQDIGRVILNLITNAFYAVNERKNEQGSDYEPKVIVHTKKVKKGIEISVKDNGNGIPKKVLEKIFQPFFTTKPTGQGTGLGLSLSYDIITAHGGELKVETKEEVGTTFIIQLTTL